MRDAKKQNLQVGRYALGEPIAAGGMATLHLGRLVGSAGFARMVAIKRLHPHLCADPNFVESFADEARLAARIRHPNVVPTLDVVKAEAELLLVMEYVDGDALSSLWKEQKKPIPLPIVIAIVSEMLHGLHAAHEAKSETGQPLGIVHRDISPQNVLVGADGVARLVDFGIARATNKVGSTGEGDVKGKLAYMAPEQIRRERVTRQTDIFAAGVVLWELLTGARLFSADNAGATVEKILVGWVAPPSSLVKEVPSRLDDIALRALDADANNRFESAREMAVALEDALPRALGREVAAWVESTAATTLAKRRDLVARAEKMGAESPSSDPVSIVASPPSAPAPSTRGPSKLTITEPTVRPEPSERRRSAAPPPPPPRPTRSSNPPAPPPTSADLHTDVSITTELHHSTTGAAHHRTSTLLMPHEPTMTVFSAGTEHDPAFAPTMNLADSIPPPSHFAAALANPTKSRSLDRLAVFIMAVAATVTLYFGVRYTRHGGTTTTATQPIATEIAIPVPVPVPASNDSEPTPTMTGTVIGATPTTASPATTTATTAAPTPPPLRRVTKAAWKSAPSKAPCVAKVDPVTQKKVYQGDCD